MVSKTRAYISFIKSIGVFIPKIRYESRLFLRNNIISVLLKEKFFDFLDTPRTPAEIQNNFGYTEPDILKIATEDFYPRLKKIVEKKGSR